MAESQSTAYEVEQAQEAAHRHEETLARTAEFRAEVAQAEQALADEAQAAAHDGTSGLSEDRDGPRAAGAEATPPASAEEGVDSASPA